jgi:folate-binding protein YgfZ
MSPIGQISHAWRPAAWLSVHGPDAFVFLQGQFSNDLRLLEKADSVYGLWLSEKGRVMADSFVLKAAQPASYWVGSYFSPAAVIRDRLDSHLIADEVEIEDQTERWFGLTMFGEPSGAKPAGAALTFSGRRAALPAVEWMYDTVGESPAGRQASPVEMERWRIEAGIPAITADLGPGDLPQEGGLEASAVSFNKGCYLGQEVMARLNSMGTPRRRLFRIAGSGVAPSRGAPLEQGGRIIGEMRSTVATDNGFIGLAMLQLMHAKPDQPLAVAGAGTLRILAAI